jgi:GNAT superfamily N-acetyltransferase
MTIIELNDIAQMLDQHILIQELYPEMSFSTYQNYLTAMLPNSYGMVIVQENNQTIGLSGFWINTKLWCGKYLELDNVIVAQQHRSKGVGQLISDFLEKKAKECNCKIMALDAYTSNFAAHKFYYNQGFVPKGFHFIKSME